MNTRTVAAFILALASVTGAHARDDLPYQWVTQQMKAAPQDAGASARLAAVAPSHPAAMSAATPVAASPAAAALTPGALRSTSVAATQSGAAQR
jgi:hypothetical protein